MNQANANAVAGALSRQLDKRNIPQSKLGMLMRQGAVESSGFTSPEFSGDNNATGMKFFGQKQATQGRAVPASEYVPGAKYGNYYAHYDNLDLWAEDYLNTVTKKGNPLTANSLEEFATKLKAQGYFQAPLADYIAALKSWEGTFKKWLPSIKSAKGIEVSLLTVLFISFIIIILINHG